MRMNTRFFDVLNAYSDFEANTAEEPLSPEKEGTGDQCLDGMASTNSVAKRNGSNPSTAHVALQNKVNDTIKGNLSTETNNDAKDRKIQKLQQELNIAQRASEKLMDQVTEGEKQNLHFNTT